MQHFVNFEGVYFPLLSKQPPIYNIHRDIEMNLLGIVSSLERIPCLYSLSMSTKLLSLPRGQRKRGKICVREGEELIMGRRREQGVVGMGAEI